MASRIVPDSQSGAIFICDMELQTTLTPTCTCTLLTHLTTRRGMCAKYKQPCAAQSKVTCNHSRLTMTPI